MNAILAWFKAHNITSHTAAAAIVGASTLIMTDEKVRDFVLGLFVKHPNLGTAIVGAAGIVFKYSAGKSPAGTVAAAKQVLNSPDAPTAKAVDAATPPKES